MKNPLLWKGTLQDGKNVEIHLTRGQKDDFSVVAIDQNGQVIGDRYVRHQGNGEYRLESSHQEYDISLDHFRTVVDVKGQKIGSRLIAFALKEIANRHGNVAKVQGIINHRWARHLEEKLGGTRLQPAQLPFEITWSKEALSTRPGQPWHEYLR